MKAIICGLLAVVVLGCSSPESSADWLTRISTEHPRMLINQDILKRVKSRAASEEKEHFMVIKADIDRTLADTTKDIHYMVYEGILPTTMLVYYVTGEKKYLDRSLQLFKDGTEYVADCFRNKKAVSWFSYARIGLYLGYDWLYDHLTPEERKKYGQMLMQNVLDMQAPADPKEQIKGENYFGFPGGGFYGTSNLFWYAGLAFYNDGVNDSLAVSFLRKGYKNQEKVMAFRGETVGDDGGISSIALGYVMGAYPRAEWNFFHTWASAIGENIAPKWDHLALLPNWVVWNVINDGKPKEYGSGDVHHFDNGMNLNPLHLAQIIHFYKDSYPGYARLAKALYDLAPNKDYEKYFWSAWYPFLIDTNVAEYEGKGPDDTWPHARFFEVLGQVFMRSGFGPDDTYCLFTADADVTGHKHFDENNFIIYKKGFLALDTGTRDHRIHTTEYYNRTVAHNCILIRKPGEKFPHHWGFVPKLNDGGQNKQNGSVLKAFETNDRYTYLVSDATAAYDSSKTEQVVRQFLFIYPDHFVILDRVVATDKEYPKTWLLHTQNKPALKGALIRAEEGGGVLFSKTLLPVDAKMTLVGGPGHEFMVDGKNFPVKEGFDNKFREKNPGKEPLFGKWRLEVTPEKRSEADVFLHVLQTGMKTEKKMGKAALVEKDGSYVVALETAEGPVEVTFSKSDMMEGGIRFGNETAGTPFTKSVQKQSGLAIKPD